MGEHTPAPWSLCGDGKCSCLTLGCPDHPIAKVQSGEWGDEYPAMRQVGASLENRYEAYMERIGYGTIDPETARANARFIQMAVNNHDALIAALRSASAQCGNVIYNCEQRPADNQRHLDSWKGVKDFIDAHLSQVTSPVGTPPGRDK